MMMLRNCIDAGALSLLVAYHLHSIEPNAQLEDGDQNAAQVMASLAGIAPGSPMDAPFAFGFEAGVAIAAIVLSSPLEPQTNDVRRVVDTSRSNLRSLE